MMIEASDVSTPTLNKYFKHVFVGVAMKDKIDRAKRKLYR